ncbi:MAG: putative 2OG-Fe(II) oxygenase [Pseudomonadales bacterium]
MARKPTKSSLAEAVRAHYAGDRRTAQRLYRRLLANEPKNPAALSGLGMLALDQHQIESATRYLRAAIKLDPQNPGYRMNLGAALEAGTDLNGAAASYQCAINLDPSYRDPYYNLANVHLKMESPDQAITVLEACQAANGRDFHALAYQVHALLDAHRDNEAQRLLDHQQLVHRYKFNAVPGYANLGAFNKALAEHVRNHPTLKKDAMSTVGGTHTGELLSDTQGPLFHFEPQIHKAIHWYIAQLPDDPSHPMRRWQPKLWKLTTWGIVMGNGGHERTHIHPNGWLSGVMYLELPDLIEDATRDHEGWLRFGQPTPDLAAQREPTLIDFQPQYGQIILFPSYFYHGTVPFHSKQRRICVSFDVEPLG